MARIRGWIPTKIYRRIHTLVPIACVDAIVIHKGKFLMGKRMNKPARGKWWFPGGRIFKGETLRHAVLRIVKGETGLRARIVKCLGADEQFFKDGHFGTPIHTITVVFLTTAKSLPTHLTLESQHERFHWFSKIQKSWHPYVKRSLRLAGFK